MRWWSKQGLPNTKVVLTGDVNVAMAHRGGVAKERAAAARPAGQSAQRAYYPRTAPNAYYPGTQQQQGYYPGAYQQGYAYQPYRYGY